MSEQRPNIIEEELWVKKREDLEKKIREDRRYSQYSIKIKIGTDQETDYIPVNLSLTFDKFSHKLKEELKEYNLGRQVTRVREKIELNPRKRKLPMTNISPYMHEKLFIVDISEGIGLEESAGNKYDWFKAVKEFTGWNCKDEKSEEKKKKETEKSIKYLKWRKQNVFFSTEGKQLDYGDHQLFVKYDNAYVPDILRLYQCYFLIQLDWEENSTKPTFTWDK